MSKDTANWYLGYLEQIDETVEVARKVCEDLESKSNFSYENHSSRQFQEALGALPERRRKDLVRAEPLARKIALLRWFERITTTRNFTNHFALRINTLTQSVLDEIREGRSLATFQIISALPLLYSTSRP